MILTIQDIGKFGGLKAQDGNFYSPSKFGRNLPKFEVGKTYDVEIKVSEKDGKTYRNIMAGKEIVANAPVVAAAPDKEEAPKAKAVKASAAKAVAFGRELSDYEVLKDQRIGAAGIVQALLQSTVYMPQIELLEPAKVDEFLVEKALFISSLVKQISEGK